MKLLDMVARESIIPELAATERNAAIRELVHCLAASKRIGADAVDGVIRAIITRERQRGTTGFGKGVAAPHAKVEGLPKIVAALGRSSRGIDFAALDGAPVFSVFLILSPADQPDEHLRAMDQVFRKLLQEKFRKFLRQSDTVDKLYDLLKEADETAQFA